MKYCMQLKLKSGILSKKMDNIFTKLKQINDWVQTLMAVAQQKQQKYFDKMKVQNFI